VDPLGNVCLRNATNHTNDILGYTINSPTGALTAILASPFATVTIAMSWRGSNDGGFMWRISGDDVSGYIPRIQQVGRSATGLGLPMPRAAGGVNR